MCLRRIKLLHIIKAQASQATIEITAGAINADSFVAAPNADRLGLLEIASGGVTEHERESLRHRMTFIPTLPNGKLTLIVIIPLPIGGEILYRGGVDELVFFAPNLNFVVDRESFQIIKNGSAGVLADVLEVFVGAFSTIPIPLMEFPCGGSVRIKGFKHHMFVVAE